jgi:hypothetical protein
MQHKTRSQLVWECKQNLIYLAKCNKVTLLWVPGHRGIADNKKADALAREGSAANTFSGPELVFGTIKTTACRSISAWIILYHQAHWNIVAGHRQSKLMVGKPSQSLAADVLQLSRTQIRVVTGLMTCHCNLRKHLHTMGKPSLQIMQ